MHVYVQSLASHRRSPCRRRACDANIYTIYALSLAPARHPLDTPSTRVTRPRRRCCCRRQEANGTTALPSAHTRACNGRGRSPSNTATTDRTCASLSPTLTTHTHTRRKKKRLPRRQLEPTATSFKSLSPSFCPGTSQRDTQNHRSFAPTLRRRRPRGLHSAIAPLAHSLRSSPRDPLLGVVKALHLGLEIAGVVSAPVLHPQRSSFPRAMFTGRGGGIRQLRRDGPSQATTRQAFSAWINIRRVRSPM